jgi:predicted RecA/RadA family phage recombinase
MTSVQNECVPLYEPGKRITIIADGAINGRRAVKTNASKGQTFPGANLHVIQAVAGDRPDGIALWDLASTETGGMIRDGVVPIDAGASVTAGTQVMVDATGRVVLYVVAGTNYPIGKAWTDATVGNPCYVALCL